MRQEMEALAARNRELEQAMAARDREIEESHGRMAETMQAQMATIQVSLMRIIY